MRHADSISILKAALLFTLAILVIGNTAALEWESPDDGSNLPGEVEFNVSNDGDDYILFEIEGPNSDTKNITGVSGDSYVTASFSAGSGNSGDYTVAAEAADGESESRDFLIDESDPSVEKKDDTEFVGDDPQIDFRVSDSYTAVTDFSLSESGLDDGIIDESRDDVCGAGGECTLSFDLDTDDVSQGDSFTLDATATDMVGNKNNDDRGDEKFSYTYDADFEADDPEFNVEGNNGGVVELNTDVDVDATVENIDDETSEVQVKCLVDGDEVDTSDFDDSEDFTCELPYDEVEDESVDVSIEACDEAGNCQESDEESITFDASEPELDNFETVQEYRVFGDDFNVRYEASDSATSIESAEYFFSTAVLEGEGNKAVVEDEEFKVETSLLSDDTNEHTVYMRVKDEAGRWSEIRSLDFDYYPDAKPSVSLNVPENFSVTADSSRGFDVVVENTGKLLVGSVNVSFSSDLFEGTQKVEDLEGGESKNAEFLLEPNSSDIGEWPVEVSTNGPVDSRSTTVLVEANTKQRNTVDNKLEEYSSKLESLESNISGLKDDGLNTNLDSSLSSGVSSFTQTVEAAQEFADQGDYYRAYSALQNVEAEYSNAQQTFSDVEKKHRINQRNQTIMMALAGLMIILAAGGAYRYSSDEHETHDIVERFREEGYELPEIGGLSAGEVRRSLNNKLDRFKQFLRDEEEEVEDAFEGFN